MTLLGGGLFTILCRLAAIGPTSCSQHKVIQFDKIVKQQQENKDVEARARA